MFYGIEYWVTKKQLSRVGMVEIRMSRQMHSKTTKVIVRNEYIRDYQ